MPYLDPTVKKEKAAEYRIKNRAILAAKERARGSLKRSAMTPSERAVFNDKQAQKLRARKEAGLFDREPGRRASKAVYERNKHDPEFRRRATMRAKAWVEKNRGRANATWRAIRVRKTESNVCYRIANALRRRFYMALKNNAKGGSAVRDLGCSIDELRLHIESKFLPGMSWDNWSRDGWHIDHKRALSNFDLSDPAQVKVACHFTNLQPLWAIDNIRKHAKQEVVV